MSDTTPLPAEQTTPSDASIAQMTPVSVSEQARLRRELRKKKMGQGADRLSKITQIQRNAAGFKEEYKDEPTSSAPPIDSTPIRPAATSTPQAAHVDDPEEVDISEHFYQPTNRPRDVPNTFPTPGSEFTLNNDQLAQMMMMNPMFGGQPGQPGAPPGPGMGPGMGPGGMPPGMPPMDPNDPIMQMMQQMMGDAGAGGAGGIPPEVLGSLLGDQPVIPESPYAKWFLVIHVLCSVLLGVYAVISTGGRWTGSKEHRIKYEGEEQIPLFWYFATMELLLQSTRYVFIERRGPPQGMILSTIARFLPPMIGKILLNVSNYFTMLSTVWQDFMVMIFTIGMFGYLNSLRDDEDAVDIGVI